MEVEPIREMTDVKAMYQWLNENRTPREAECFLIGCNVALRAGDLLRIKFSDVEGKQFIDLNEQKTTKFKRIPITKTVRDAAERLRVFYEKGNFYSSHAEKWTPTYLFQSTGNRGYHLCQPICIQWLSACFKDAANDLQFSFNLNTHSMRKTWGYRAYKANEDIHYIQAAFNHSTSRITLAYIGITRATVEQLYRDHEMEIA